MKTLRGVKNLPKDTVYDEIDSPVGTLIIFGSSKGLHAILWESDKANPKYQEIMKGLKKGSLNPTIKETKKQLQEYFTGKRKEFKLPLVLNGTTFQAQCWQELLKIPYSQTVSYGEQAIKVGNKNKARAVGMANGLNPISIVIPCHRVIGKSGDLTGFAGGLETKRFLLNLEKKNQ